MSAYAATGLAAGEQALPELAAIAVKDALANAGMSYAHSILLFLSGHFGRLAREAVAAASRAAGCLQVMGCTVPGVLTEKAWVLDQPAAAALVMFGDISLGLPIAGQPTLSLAQPESAVAPWLTARPERFGTLATDQESSAQGRVWHQGKPTASGMCEAGFHGATTQIGVSRGLRLVSPPLTVGNREGHEIFRLSDKAALNTLLEALPEGCADIGSGLNEPPLTKLFAAILEPDCDPDLAMAEERYLLLPIVALNQQERSVTLAAPLPRETRLCWAILDPRSAAASTGAAVESLLPATPAFGLVFSCIGRGPYFYQGHDGDVAQLSARFPDLPIIGTYGAGEIGPQGSANATLSYSTVFALVSADV